MAMAHINIDPDADRALSAMVEALGHLARSRDDRFSGSGVAGRLNTAILAAIRLRYGTVMDESRLSGQQILDRSIDGRTTIGAAVAQLEHEATTQPTAAERAEQIVAYVKTHRDDTDRCIEQIMWCGGPDVFTELVRLSGCDPERDRDDVVVLGGYRDMMDAIINL